MEFVLMLGLCGFLWIRLLLTLPWPAKWLEVKPFSCITCLSGWFSIVLSLVMLVRTGDAELVGSFSAGGATLLCLTAYQFVFPRFPNFPSLG